MVYGDRRCLCGKPLLNIKQRSTLLAHRARALLGCYGAGRCATSGAHPAFLDDKENNSNASTVRNSHILCPILLNLAYAIMEFVLGRSSRIVFVYVLFPSRRWSMLHQQKVPDEVAKALACTLGLAQGSVTIAQELGCVCIRDEGRAGP